MAFLYKAKKTYLRAVAVELGIVVMEKMIKPQIIKAIMASEHFEEKLVSNMLEEEKIKSKQALEIEEKRRNEAIEDRRRREQMEFELQKLRLENERTDKKKVSAEIYDHFLDEWWQLKIPEEFANKLDDFENVRTDRKIKESSWRDHPGDRYRYDSHIARECPKRHRETISIKRELNNGEDVLTAEIKSHLLKSEKSTNLLLNIPINALQNVTTLVDDQELRTVVDSGAQSEDKDEFHGPIEILAAVSNRVQGQFIIPTNVYELLRNSNEGNNQYDEHSRDNQNHQHSKKPLPEESSILCAEVDGDDGVEEKVSYMNESSQLIHEQKKCESLEEVRKFARRGKGDFLVIDGLLFHREKMLGDAIIQLVLPLSRRAQVLKLAHESVFGSHMGVKKTKERIRYSFYWPMMSREIAEYCKSCKEYQLRSPEKMIDKIPITPVLRPEPPF
ncbi:hypothetical protein AVEN_77903-1 [Araneus ventricosus]|uniref:RNA-directed DNA polymerase n=1 Tax=Araneus ventricosus TaxID=182803 RepID=A0A4Y2DUJ1_ARAVE|nr:hypothetical protein AVEN_77903-1 [Araneus ventricosus]